MVTSKTTGCTSFHNVPLHNTFYFTVCPAFFVTFDTFCYKNESIQ